MDLAKVNNRNVLQLDWAADERRAALAKIPAMRAQKSNLKIAGVAAGSVWMSDLSGSDRRSVKAWLCGRGDARVALWRAKELLARFAGKSAQVDGEEIQRTSNAGGRISVLGQIAVKAWSMLAPAAAAGSAAR